VVGLPERIKVVTAALVEAMVEILLALLVLVTLRLQPQVKEVTVVLGQEMRLLIMLAVVVAVLVR
jgi:hypothetical protein